jgi:NADP-dependent 3-hydroxy acid dehydrogenase YdfG
MDTTKTKTIVVTGATSGIGEATVHRLPAAGHRVFATGRNPEALARRRALGGVDAATKYAIESISDGLRAELHPMGIRVVLTEPGVINTGFNSTAIVETRRPRARYVTTSPHARRPLAHPGPPDRLGRLRDAPGQRPRLRGCPARARIRGPVDTLGLGVMV